MTSQCANPACAVPLRMLNNGRLFQFEVRPRIPPRESDTETKDLVTAARTDDRISRFWLCGECASRLTLAFDKIKGVVVRPFCNL